jgi:hypothetical protein
MTKLKGEKSKKNFFSSTKTKDHPNIYICMNELYKKKA